MEKIKRRSYPTDLTDKQWEEIAPLFVGMRNRKWEKGNWSTQFCILWIVVANDKDLWEKF